jgi:hypothetical protein
MPEEESSMSEGGSNQLLKLEGRGQPLLNRGAFARRWALFACIALLLIVGSLGLGMLGYHLLEGLPWIDSYLNAAMLLGGMGPVSELHRVSAKIFAGLYAMFSGLVLLVSVGVILAPVFHRFLHKFHLDPEQDRAS